MVSRAHRTPFAEWWWTVDRLTLAALGALMLAGIVLSLAASPPVAGRLGLDPFYFVNRPIHPRPPPPPPARLGLAPFYFVNRHILFLAPTIAVLLGVSFLSPRQIRRLSLVMFIVSIAMVAVTPIFGAEIKGAKRWLIIFGVNIQPSEFLKPAFVIIISWLFGESAKRPDMPANAISLVLLLGVVALLVIQPDFGQTMLIVLVWSALFFMAGMRLIWMFGIAGIASFGLTVAYYTVPHVANRIQKFMNPASGDTFNIDIATESFMRGGWLGTGPGEGTAKRLLPESHTDFVFAVAGEEFGVALCLALAALFALIVIRLP